MTRINVSRSALCLLVASAAVVPFIAPVARAERLPVTVDELTCETVVKDTQGREVGRIDAGVPLVRKYDPASNAGVRRYRSASVDGYQFTSAGIRAGLQLGFDYAVESNGEGRPSRAAFKECHYLSLKRLAEPFHTIACKFVDDPFAPGSGYQPVALENDGIPRFPRPTFTVNSWNDGSGGSAVTTCRHLRSLP